VATAGAARTAFVMQMVYDCEPDDLLARAGHGRPSHSDAA
jgi:hypothetical protein